MENLLKGFAVRALGIFSNKLDVILSPVKEKQSMSSWLCFESPGDCCWTTS